MIFTFLSHYDCNENKKDTRYMKHNPLNLKLIERFSARDLAMQFAYQMLEGPRYPLNIYPDARRYQDPRCTIPPVQDLSPWSETKSERSSTRRFQKERGVARPQPNLILKGMGGWEKRFNKTNILDLKTEIRRAIRSGYSRDFYSK